MNWGEKWWAPSQILMVGFYPAGRERQKGNEPRTAYSLVPRAGCPGRRKVFGYAPFSAQLEQSEVFVPVSHGNFRISFKPQLQLIQIRKGDAAIAHSLDQVSPQRLGKLGPLLDLWALPAKDHLSFEGARPGCL